MLLFWYSHIKHGYFVTGGLSAVIWTDFVQVAIMIVGAFVLMGISKYLYLCIYTYVYVCVSVCM